MFNERNYKKSCHSPLTVNLKPANITSFNFQIAQIMAIVATIRALPLNILNLSDNYSEGVIMFDKKLKALLRSHNLSVAELAKRTGLPRSTIQQWTAGGTPNVYQLEKVATYFNITIDELVFDKKPKQAIEELFTEALVHTGHYKIQITKLTKKDESQN